MGILETIELDLHSAMKTSNKPVTETLRLVKTELTKFEKSDGNVGKTLTENDYLSVLQKIAKQRSESAEIYKDAGRNDLADKELIELSIITKYLPTPMTDFEVETIIKNKISETGLTLQKDFGTLMKSLTIELKGKSDGKLISTILKKLLV